MKKTGLVLYTLNIDSVTGTIYGMTVASPPGQSTLCSFDPNTLAATLVYTFDNSVNIPPSSTAFSSETQTFSFLLNAYPPQVEPMAEPYFALRSLNVKTKELSAEMKPPFSVFTLMEASLLYTTMYTCDGNKEGRDFVAIDPKSGEITILSSNFISPKLEPYLTAINP